MTKLELIKYRRGIVQWKMDISKLTTAKLLRLIMAVKGRDVQIKRRIDHAINDIKERSQKNATN